MVLKSKRLIKNRLIILMLIIILALASIILFSHHDNSKVEINNGLSSGDKKVLKYDYEIPTNLNVLDIKSDKELVIEESNKLKIYNITNSKSEEKLADISEGFKVVKAIIFDKGIVWVENRTTPDIVSRIYIKYFSSTKANLLDESKSDILPSISLSQSSRYLNYYIVNEDKVNVKYYDLDENVQKTVASYTLKDEKGFDNLVSAPNSDDNSIVWSYSTTKESSMFKYNINNGQIEMLSNSDLHGPVVKNGKIFAIKRYDYYDDELKDKYAKDYIVQYDYNTKQWSKFAEGKIDNFLDKRECITVLSVDKGLFYWYGTVIEGACVYDFATDKFTPLAERSSYVYYYTSVKIAKGNLVYYEARDINNNFSNFFYIVK